MNGMFSQAFMQICIDEITLSSVYIRWVLLKNVHLAPQWLVTLEKKLHTLNPHANFRLFLTMEINPKVCQFELNLYSHVKYVFAGLIICSLH